MVAMLSSKWQLVFFTALMGFPMHLQSQPTKGETKSLAVKLDQPVYLQLKKDEQSRCVTAKWKRLQAGDRTVTYAITFRNSLREVLAAGIGYNIWKIKVCNSEAYAAITYVELRISFKGTSKIATAKVYEAPTNAPLLTSSSTSSGVSTEGIAALALLFGLIVIFAGYISLRRHIQHCMRN